MACMRTRIAFLLAATCFAAAFALPFWKMTLVAPQYPDGLRVEVGVSGLSGDVGEINGLNHYIGMRKLQRAAEIELVFAPYGLAGFVLLALAAAFVRNRWLDLALLVPIAFPLVFLVDVSIWLWYFGNHLDPHAPLSTSVKPFTPLVLFWSHVGQFKTYSMVQGGFASSAIGSGLLCVGLWLRRRQANTSAAGQTVALAGALIIAALFLSGRNAAAFDLQGAIDHAPAGSTVAIPAGVHRGNFVVRRAMTLVPRGSPGSAVLDGGGRGRVLQVLAPDVTVRGLRIRNSGDSSDLEDSAVTVLAPRARIEQNRIENALFGIYLRGATGSVVRGNHIEGKDLPMMRRGDAIKLWASPDCRVEENVVLRGRDLVIWYSDRVHLSGNTVRDGRYGIHFMYSMDNVIEGNRLLDNRVGSFLMYSKRLVIRSNLFARNRGPSGYGVGLKEIDGLEMSGNRFVANRVGLYVDNSPSEIDQTHLIRDNLFAYNEIGVAFLPAVQRNVFTENAFIENGQQTAVFGGGDFTGNAFALSGRGNYWSDYIGWDAAQDGVGDVPYRMDSLFDTWMDRDPRLRLFRGSLAAWLVDFAARMFPVFRPEVRVVDTAPLTTPPRTPAGPAPPAEGSPAPVIAACLLLAACVIALARPQRSGLAI